MTNSTLTAAALVLCAFTGSAGTADAADGLPSRVVFTVGQVIATQGNAALMQIRHDLKRSALKTIEPFLPQASDSSDSDESREPAAEAPAPTPLAQRYL